VIHQNSSVNPKKHINLESGNTSNKKKIERSDNLSQSESFSSEVSRSIHKKVTQKQSTTTKKHLSKSNNHLSLKISRKKKN
jgi:hypothetical protein